jgi:hypothetical protein
VSIFNLFKSPKTEKEQFTEQFRDQLFPGGDQELAFRGKKVMELSNGKLDLEAAIQIIIKAKARFKFACAKFDGVRHLSPSAEEMLERTKADSRNKLSAMEAAAIIYYAIFDKTDDSLESLLTVKKWIENLFGSDSRGCDSDAIPEGLGEFGFDPTNPVPVRGIASNTIYLGRLRTRDGGNVTHKRVGSTIVPNILGNIDVYEIHQSEKNLCRLHISPYNRRISSRAPEGFVLVFRTK